MQKVYSLQEVHQIADWIINNCQSQNLLFYGEMGVGKTTLIKSIVNKLGSQDQVTSPTFSLVNEYHAGNHKIFHFDFYRINSEEEVYDIGIEDYFLNEKDWILMEWPELIPNLVPEKFSKISIELTSNMQRRIKLTEID